MVKKSKKEEILFACDCKTQETTRKRSLEGEPTKVTDGKDCECRIARRKAGTDDVATFSKKQQASVVVRTTEPTGGFIS